MSALLKSQVSGWWLRVLMLSCFLSGVAMAQTPDRIFYNGKIVTVDKNFSIKSAVAIVPADHGNRTQPADSARAPR